MNDTRMTHLPVYVDGAGAEKSYHLSREETGGLALRLIHMQHP